MAFKILLLAALVSVAMAGPVELVSKGNNLFTNRMYQELAKKPGNVFFSPISAHTVLSLVAQGAAGDTLKEFNAVLGVDQKASADGYQGLMTTLNNIENVTLHLANKVYVQDTYKMKENFKSVASEKFLTKAESINFAENTKAASNINEWCLAKTNNKIKDVIKAGDLNSDTRMVLLNAIYFKGLWNIPFKKENTQKKPFYVSETETVDVDMMFLSESFHYGFNEALDAEILEMKYKNQDVSMVIVLPKDKFGIAALEQKMANFDLSTLTQGLYKTKVDVSLPKFKIETEMPLNDVLTSMGIAKAFSSDADFSQLLDSPERLVISKAIQKAFIEVNEEGAEAAAVTAIIMFGSSMMPSPKPAFKADHPFLYMLQVRVDQQTNVLFYGLLSNPKET